MATVSFSYRSIKEKAKIEIRLTIGKGKDRHSFYTRSNFEVSKSFWDEYLDGKTFRDIEKINNKAKLDKHLNNLRSHIVEKFQECKSVNKQWFIDTVEEFYRPKSTDKNNNLPNNLVDYFYYYLEEKKYELKPGTVKRLKAVLHKLERFQNYTGKEVLFRGIDNEFKRRWIEFGNSENYSLNYTYENFRNIKNVCNHAKRMKIELSDEYDRLKFKIPQDPTPVIYLNFEELRRIQDLHDLKEYLDNARDWLIISCFTGQRVSDFKRFTPEMIHERNGRRLIELDHQKKTGEFVSIPLTDEVEKILKKKGGNFPRPISDQRYNDYIKEVCKLAGINSPTKGGIVKNINGDGDNPIYRKVQGVYPKYQLITSHCGRRSFASNFFGHIKTSYLKNITGHETENDLLTYIGKTSKDTAIEAFDQLKNVER